MGPLCITALADSSSETETMLTLSGCVFIPVSFRKNEMCDIVCNVFGDRTSSMLNPPLDLVTFGDGDIICVCNDAILESSCPRCHTW